MSKYKSPAQIKKELGKGADTRRKSANKLKEEISAMPEYEKILLEIDNINSRILRCKSDLNGMFKNNRLIENKLANLEIQLKEKLQEKKKYEEEQAKTTEPIAA